VFILVNYSQTCVQEVALRMLRAPVLSIGPKKQLDDSMFWAVYTLLQVCDMEADITSLLQCKTDVSNECTKGEDKFNFLIYVLF